MIFLLKVIHYVNGFDFLLIFVAYHGWYQRIENNGWRPVSNKHLLQMNLDFYYGVEKYSKPIVFYHSKVIKKKFILKI